MTKCLLFDCDGTLVDSERLCNIGLVVKFKELGVTLDADDLVSRFRGWKLSTILDLLQNENSVQIPNDFVDSYRQGVSELFEKELKPVDGIKDILEQLDFPKAVVSSGPRHKIEQALRVCGLTEYFDGNIYSSYEVGAWKPDPKNYDFSARDMGYAPSDCAAIEDGLVGVEAGVKAGIKTYFYNVYHEPCDWPEVIGFDSMYELPALISHNQVMNSAPSAPDAAKLRRL